VCEPVLFLFPTLKGAIGVSIINKLRARWAVFCLAIALTGCAFSATLSATAQAYLKKDTMRAATSAYSLVDIQQVSNSSGYHNASSSPTTVHWIRRDASSFWYWEHWNFAYNANNKFAYGCWIQIMLQGNSRRVNITLLQNSRPCGGFPFAVFNPKTGELVTSFT
jgi:hypothetical protein